MYFFSESFAVNLYPVTIVARAFEESAATIFIVSISCGSDLH